MENEESENILVKCGYCRKTCLNKEAHKHSCIRIFDEFFVDVDTYEFWAYDSNGIVSELSEEHFAQIENIVADKENTIVNINRNIVNNDKNVRTSKKKAKAPLVNTVQLKLDQEEQLIFEVMTRVPLWNFTIPLEERSKVIKKKLWSEVSDSLKGAFTPDGAKKKFKTLTDTFRKIIRDEQCPSGSARRNNGNKWAHYDSMQFLREHFILRETVSNCEFEENDSDGTNLSDHETDNVNMLKRNSREIKRRKKNTDDIDLSSSIDKIAEAISSSSRDLVLPPPPELTEIDSCLNIIGSRLKKIPEVKQSDAIQEMLQLSYNILKEYNN